MNDSIGPKLPPNLGTCRENSVSAVVTPEDIGPTLPPWLKTGHDASPDAVTGVGDCSNDKVEAKPLGTVDAPDSFGPSLPPGFTASSSPQEHASSDEEPIIGPLPPSKIEIQAKTIGEDFDKRARKMKDRLTGKELPKKLEREEWMTELPPLLQGFGGGPRKFRAHERIIGDRSVWTDTPGDKAKKMQGKDPITDKVRVANEAMSRRDAEISAMLGNNNGKESLMSMHDKERKRKAKEEENSGEAKLRRPFDRDIDLQANQFDEAAKKRMLKQSQGLSSRFSSGTTTSKFL